LSAEREIRAEAKALRVSRLAIDATKVYSLAGLVDFAERNNPQTRVAWEGATARAADLHIAQSELYPALVAVALAQVNRLDLLFGSSFVRQTIAAFGPGLQLHYTLFDFGARGGRIAAARAELAAANFDFNDTHRKLIFQVADTYYRLLNAAGQVDAAKASLLNAKTVQEAAEQRLEHGLARSATAQAEYDLQSARGAEEIARGDLATTLAIAPTYARLSAPKVQLIPSGARRRLTQLGVPRSLAKAIDGHLGNGEPQAHRQKDREGGRAVGDGGAYQLDRRMPAAGELQKAARQLE
jgi:outer membrane protein TolC